MRRVGSILKCTYIATARSAGHSYPKAVKNSRRSPLKLLPIEQVHSVAIKRRTPGCSNCFSTASSLRPEPPRLASPPSGRTAGGGWAGGQLGITHLDGTDLHAR